MGREITLKNRSRALRNIGLAIWKAVAMAPVFRSLGGVETCGGGNFAPCDRLLPARSQGTSRLGGVIFWGNFTVTGRHEPAFQIASIE